MRLIAWNILQGAGNRSRSVADELLRYNADLITLTEFRLPAAQAVIDSLAERGYRHRLVGDPVQAGNRIALFSRLPFLVYEAPFSTPAFRNRWMEVALPTVDVTVATVYGPMGEVKKTFWTSLLRAADERRHRRFVLLGDLNTGDSRCDREGAPFNCSEEFVELGYVLRDAWRHVNGNKRDFSWFSWKRGKTGKNGFRIDHAFVSQPLLSHVRGCRYEHGARERQLSDHSILILELD